MFLYLIAFTVLITAILLILALFYYEYNGLFQRSYSRLIIGGLLINLAGLFHRVIAIQLPPIDITHLLDGISNDFVILEAHATGLFLVLINIQTLTIFKTLDERITPLKIRVLYGLYLPAYVCGAIVHVTQNYIPAISPLLNYFILVETPSALVLDNCIGIFLSIILYRKIKSIDADNHVVKAEIAQLIGGNIVAVCNSWAAFLLLIYIDFVTPIDNNRTYLYFTQHGLVCIHALILVVMFLKYKRIALLRKEELSEQSKKEGTIKKLLMPFSTHENKHTEAPTVVLLK
ncbi:hypothetical protein HDV06_006845 [Boothiomyces sp. JEL0866]|nr:hypothetical protein HDV06_006845 [Boothiomyces sp. JEL0866]